MPQVTRPTKTAGNTTYVEEVADGAVTILASEVDADFAAMIVGINTVDTAQLANSAVTTAKIADLNVTTAKLANGSVTQEKIATGLGLMRNLETDISSSFVITNPSTTETTVFTFPAITTTGGAVFLMGSWEMQISIVTSDSTGPAERTITVGSIMNLTVRVKRDGSTFYTLVMPFAFRFQGVRVEGNPADMDCYMAVPFPTAIDTPAAGGPYVYTVTVQPTWLSGSDGEVISDNDGVAYIFEGVAP